jgi:hypothetical protein
VWIEMSRGMRFSYESRVCGGAFNPLKLYNFLGLLIFVEYNLASLIPEGEEEEERERGDS